MVQENSDVWSLFVLLFCARPLAGPPDDRTDSAIAPDPKASASAPFWGERRETDPSPGVPIKSQPR